MATAVVIEEAAGALSDGEENSFRHRFAWGPTFAGAVVGTATILFLLTLGAGFGLSLVPATGVASKGFLTLGAIYFLAAQAMGFAAGGHLVGRLIGPMVETDREEEFRAAAHGLTVWGLCVTATAVLVLMSSWVAAGSSAIAGGLAMSTNSSANPSPAVAAYWTDVLFRPAPAPMHSARAWQRYAQADNTANDAAPPAIDEEAHSANAPTARPMTPVPNAPGSVETDTTQSATPAAQTSAPPRVITIPTEDEAGVTNATAPISPPASRNLAADKGEVGRILEASWANSGTISTYDRDRVAELVSQDTGVQPTEAARRVDNAQAQMKRDQLRAAEAARRIARNASLWIAFALLFGAIVATMAAISARWEDDRITFGWRRSEPA